MADVVVFVGESGAMWIQIGLGQRLSRVQCARIVDLVLELGDAARGRQVKVDLDHAYARIVRREDEV